MYNFTLIIPTHNRHDYLTRSIAYYKDLNANVIYCDSSQIRYEGATSSNIEYRHMPNKKFADKILLGLEEVKTSFVALCADDDFILIDSLYEGIVLLESNAGFKTVVGKYIAFKEVFDGNFYYRYNALPKDLNFNAEKNAELFFKDYFQILWAMYDKTILTNAFKIIRQANFKNDNFIEIVIGACACYVGGIRFLNSIWGIRELNTKDHWGARHKTISNIHADAEIERDFLIFQDLLDKTTLEGYSKIVIDNYLKTSQNYLSYIKKSIKFFLPDALIELVQKNNAKHSELPMIKLDETESMKLEKIIEILAGK